MQFRFKEKGDTLSRLNFNKSPYFDDYKSGKNFLKVLFKGGRAVQPRELNQIQSIFQNQIEKFASHVFKNGSRISNARASLNAKNYVRLDNLSPWVVDPLNPNGYPVKFDNIKVGINIVGMSSGISARLVKTVSAENNDPPTIYIVYTGVAIDGVTNTFLPGEVLKFYDQNGIPFYSVKVKCPGCSGSQDLDTIYPTGQGKIFTIDEGVFYYEGMFIENARQDIIISKYGETIDCKIGFDFIQTIVTSDDDLSLLDNTLGYPNNTAPGADRYKIDLVLVKRSLSVEDGDNFILLAKYENGNYRFLKADSEYSDIMDMIAKRTFETNGNYTVRPFQVRFIEDKAIEENDPKGYSLDGDPDYVRAIVSDGVSYVLGYRFENSGDQFLRMMKARDTKKSMSFTKYFDDRTYIKLKPIRSYSAYPNNPLVAGNMDNTSVTIYDGPFTSGLLPSGNMIGSFKVYDVRQDSGVINAPDGTNIPVSSINVVSEVATVITTQPHTILSGGIAIISGATPSGLNGRFVVSEVVNGTTFRYLAKGIANVSATGSISFVKEGNAAVFKYYIYDLKMLGEHKLSEARSFVDSNQTNGFKAEPSSDGTTIYNPGKMELVWKLDRDNIKTLRSISDANNLNPPGSIAIFLRKKMAGVLNSEGKVTFTSYTNEWFQPFDQNSTVAVITDNDLGAGIIHTVDLSQSGRFSMTPTTITIDLGTTLDVGKGSPLTVPGNTITIIHNVLRTNAQEDSKTFSVTDEIANITPSLNDIPLGISDAYSIDYAYEYNPNTSGNEIDIKEYLSIESGLTDSAYRESVIKIDPSMTIRGQNRWRIKVKYLDHNNSNQLGYYTVDSYRQLLADGDLNYDDGLMFEASNKSKYSLFDSFDFRPSVINGVVIGGNVPVIGSTAIFDIEYYLGRIDLLQVDKDNRLYIKKGTPSDSPIPPSKDDNAMALYEIHLKPYTYSLNDIQVKYIENKRYTMRDIGKLENRIKTIEYYTTLSLLEKRTQDMSIKDANGLDRFKNGFVADNFSDYQAGDVTSSDFRAALDRKNKELRPAFTSRNKKLKLLENQSTAKLLGKMAIIDYDSLVVDEQPFATKHISVNPHFQYRKMGEMILTPNNDTWSDTQREPDLIVKVDTGLDAIKTIAQKSGVLGTEWGSWTTLNRTIVDNSIKRTEVDFHPELGIVTVKDQTVTSNLTRTGQTRTIDERKDDYDLGDRVTDVSINPYMRKTEIQFFATKMKPNTKIWAFFDKKPVSQYVRPLKGIIGDQLITDTSGQVSGIFEVPEGMFFTGDREFYLTSDEKLTGDADVETTAAKALFFSGGLNLTKQRTTLNVLTPVIKTESTSQTKTIQEHVVDVDELNYVPCPVCSWCAGCADPIAQSFKLKDDRFLTGLDVYFKDIDTNVDEIFFQIRNVVGGFPGETILTEKRFLTTSLIKSDDSKTPFHVEFDFPVYVKGNEWYCFVIGGYTPDTRVWVAKLGEDVVDQPGKIVETQPAIGSSFRSQNASTWNAEQYEDIKYKLYAAKFKTSDLSLKFEHTPERIKLDRDPFEAEATKNRLRVYIPDHGFNVNDKVSISMLEDEWIEIQVTNGQMQIGLKVTTLNGFEGIVTDYTTNQIVSKIKMKNIKGTFNVNEQFLCAQMDWNVHDNYLVTKMGYKSSAISSDGMVRYNQVNGTFKSNYTQSINGILISNINKQHVIAEIDSMDSIIIEVANPANASGRFGGETVNVEINEKYEIFNVSGAYLPYGSQELIEYQGIFHNPLNGPFQAQNYQKADKISIRLGEDNHLGQPHKIVCSDNKSSGGRMVEVSTRLVSNSEWLSPVVNTDTFSITTISNRIEWTDSSQYNVEPNATGRYRSESDPMNGSENYKYVSKTINLKNPATDLVIAFDVYKDINSDFDVWIKVVAPYEGLDIDTKRWMRINGIDKTYNSVDLLDRIDLEIELSKYRVDVYTSDTNFTTIEWNNLPNDEFSAFKVKIVGKSKNPAKPPLFQSFRAIAVT